MTKRTRTGLKNLFSAGALPTETHFHDKIESGINQVDDRLQRDADTETPIKLTSWGSDQSLLDLHAHGEAGASWKLKSAPPVSAADATIANGLDFSSAETSRLFIEEADGKVGLANRNPNAHLHIVGTFGQALRLDDGGGDAPDLVVKANGKAGFGVEPADSAAERVTVEGKIKSDQLEVTGDTGIGGTLTIEGNLVVNGNQTENLTEIHRGNIQLGDGDTDTVTFEGVIVSGNSTDHLEINDIVHVSEKLHIGGSAGQAPANRLDVSGGAVIGSGHAATATAPASSLNPSTPSLISARS